jgi:hypothetical protein
LVIDKETYSHLLNNPNKVSTREIELLKELIDTYPFCSTSRILHLKGLQNIKSIHYNQTLKETAAYAGDRQRLFYLLTKEKDNAKKAESAVKPKKIEPEINDEKSFLEKELEIGQPLEFEKEEKHSFNEWLKLSQARPIQRSSKTKSNLQKKVSLIEDFIANRDRKPKKEFYSASNKAKESVKFHFDIVTETLAKVYLEQGHYEKAKAAYKQLSLKYPQKSSLFASQIELIDQLITKNK